MINYPDSRTANLDKKIREKKNQIFKCKETFVERKQKKWRESHINETDVDKFVITKNQISSNPLKEKCQMCEKQMPKHENVAKTKNTRIKFPNLESIKHKTHVNEDIKRQNVQQNP